MKTYEDLAAERDELANQLDQYKDMKGHSSHSAVERLYKEKQLEIKNWIKANPRNHTRKYVRI